MQRRATQRSLSCRVACACNLCNSVIYVREPKTYKTNGPQKKKKSITPGNHNIFLKNIYTEGFSGTMTSSASGMQGSAEIEQGASSSMVSADLGVEGASEVRKYALFPLEKRVLPPLNLYRLYGELLLKRRGL